MAQMISHPPVEMENEAVDDLKLISGIGPAIERRFISAGITTFAQLSEMSMEDLTSLFADMTGLSAQRLAEKNWIGQARELAASSTTSGSQNPAVPPENRQHYAVFTLEFLLDESNKIRRTRAFSVQNQSEVTWAGFDQERLYQFMTETMGIKTLLPVKREPVSVAAPTVSEQKSTASAERAKAVVQPMNNEFYASRFEIWTDDDSAGGKQKMITSNTPVNIALTLDLSRVNGVHQNPFDYQATVYARQVGSKTQEIIGKSQGKLVPADYVRLNIEGKPLAQGIYHVEAIITLIPPDEEFSLRNAMMAMAESELIQVF